MKLEKKKIKKVFFYKRGDLEFSDWTNSLIQDSEERDIYIGVVGKDLLWLESSAAPLIE